MSVLKKCYACGAQAVAKFIRKFNMSGMIKEVYSCADCINLTDEQFEIKRKNNRDKNNGI